MMPSIASIVLQPNFPNFFKLHQTDSNVIIEFQCTTSNECSIFLLTKRTIKLASPWFQIAIHGSLNQCVLVNCCLPPVICCKGHTNQTKVRGDPDVFAGGNNLQG